MYYSKHVKSVIEMRFNDLQRIVKLFYIFRNHTRKNINKQMLEPRALQENLLT